MTRKKATMDAPERPTQAEPKPVAVNARRKLIRGAFALPAMAAVHSGSALAASSSLRCLGNGLPGTQAPGLLYFGVPEPSGITYRRVPLAVAKKVGTNVSGPDYLYYVSYGDVLFAANVPKVGISTSFVTQSSPFRLFSVGTNSVSGSGLASIASGYALQERSTLANAMRPFAVLIYNAAGTEIVGAGVTNTAGFAASASCWTSFGL